MSDVTSNPRKRAVESGASQDNSKRTKVVDVLHPYYLLEHIVNVVIPRHAGKKEGVASFYKEILDNPKSAIETCKGLLHPWIVDMYEKGTLLDFDKYDASKFATDFPEHSGAYMHLMWLDNGAVQRYGGQGNDLKKRIMKEHRSPSHRRRNPALHYFYLDHSWKDAYLITTIPDRSIEEGPILNIVEQWQCLIFRSLQPVDMERNLAPESFSAIAASDLVFGANLRIPLAQGLGFSDMPMWNFHLFKDSDDPVKKLYYEARKEKTVQEDVDLRNVLLSNEVYPHSFWVDKWWNKATNMQFVIRFVRFNFGKTFFERWEPGSIRVWCDLRPEGQSHEQCVTGRFAREVDPARRLGIKISGILKCRNNLFVGDVVESWVWVEKKEDGAVHQCNYLVDFLEGKDLSVVRPRRWYPPSEAKCFEGWRRGFYTPDEI